MWVRDHPPRVESIGDALGMVATSSNLKSETLEMRASGPLAPGTLQFQFSREAAVMVNGKSLDSFQVISTVPSGSAIPYSSSFRKFPREAEKIA
jgi:hypothetical protein